MSKITDNLTAAITKAPFGAKNLKIMIVSFKSERINTNNIEPGIKRSKSVYVKELEKFCKRKLLKDLKMPMRRKRDIARDKAFAITQIHKRAGVPTRVY